MTITVRLSRRLKDKKEVEADDGALVWELWVRTSAPENPAPAQPYAYAERLLPPGGLKEYRKSRGDGARHFVLWADRHRQQALARVVTRPAPEGQAPTYEILGAAGESLAVVTRKRALTGGCRTRWTVQQVGGQPAVGRKGNPFWWAVWWLILPIQIVIAVGSIIGGGDIARTPRRIKWRSEGRGVLDWTDNLNLAVADPGHWDPRVTAGLVTLLKSWDGILGDSWDKEND
ncbi:hypothetical protein QIS99_03435 [Streptomyces sp. B-S-A8]|uniref:Uncharacterized protein n=1 Tax=Streptomyces solicavernae TaxID=3043614 RepID=A0ABT6RLG1_9ACTN|nr:hypothetical protein [Streptomyces sp. B-S-A8]MDI3385273.1 hypothetical protein [Streptomyces sp. B-S-A8]